jgi:hypothetical protein
MLSICRSQPSNWFQLAPSGPPSFTIQQASLAVIWCAAGIVAGWQRPNGVIMIAAVLFGLVVPFTLW